jgi:hypothetical protein
MCALKGGTEANGIISAMTFSMLQMIEDLTLR